MAKTQTAEQREAAATQYGMNPRAFEAEVDRVSTKSGKFGKLLRKKSTRAREDFEARGGTSAKASVQVSSRGGGGGTQVVGDFGPGAIRLDSVTPVNSKKRGR